MHRALVVAACLALFAGCGDDSNGERNAVGPSSAPTTASANTDQATEAMCEAFRDIAFLDDRFRGELNSALSDVIAAAQAGDDAAADAALRQMVVELQALIPTTLEPLLDAYDRLRDAAPQLAADAQLVRDFTAEVGQGMADAGGAEEVLAVFEDAAEGEGVAVGSAVLRLDEVSRAECDIIIAD